MASKHSLVGEIIDNLFLSHIKIYLICIFWLTKTAQMLDKCFDNSVKKKVEKVFFKFTGE